MNKRIKKKKHIYPFTEYGIDLDAEWVGDYKLIPKDQSDANEFNKRFCALLDKMDELKLECGGGANNKTIGFFVCSSQTSRKLPSQLVINELRTWMESTGWWKNIVISAYIDAWYPERKMHKGDERILTAGNEMSELRKWVDDNHLDIVGPGIIEGLVFE